MLRSTVLTLLLAMQLSGLVAAQETKPITEAETVLAIYTNNWGLRASSRPKLIFSAWGNGTVVWSSDHLKGGPPYLTAQLDPEDVSATLDRLIGIGVFESPQLEQARVGPDSQFTTLLVRSGGKELKMDSWHELYESNGKVVAADRGLTGLEGRKLLLALAEQPADYLHYRMTWLELRLAAANLVPKAGKETAGVPVMLRGTLSWQSNEDRTNR